MQNQKFHSRMFLLAAHYLSLSLPLSLCFTCHSYTMWWSEGTLMYLPVASDEGISSPWNLFTSLFSIPGLKKAFHFQKIAVLVLEIILCGLQQQRSRWNMKITHFESWILWIRPKTGSHLTHKSRLLLPVVCCFCDSSAQRRHHEDGQSEEGQPFWREHRHVHRVFPALRAYLLRRNLLHRDDELSQVLISFFFFFPKMIDFSTICICRFLSLLFLLIVVFVVCFHEGSSCPRRWELIPVPSLCASQRKQENQYSGEFPWHSYCHFCWGFFNHRNFFISWCYFRKSMVYWVHVFLFVS